MVIGARGRGWGQHRLADSVPAIVRLGSDPSTSERGLEGTWIPPLAWTILFFLPNWDVPLPFPAALGASWWPYQEVLSPPAPVEGAAPALILSLQYPAARCPVNPCEHGPVQRRDQEPL